MKKASHVLLLALAFVTRSVVQAQSATLDFTLGILTNSSGTTPIIDGSLIQVIAASNNTFLSPTATSFIGGDSAHELIIFSGGLDSTTADNTPGASVFEFQVPIPDGIVTTNAAFVVRWFPSLASAGNPSAPGATTFGEYGFTTGATTWVIPAAGNQVSFEMLTVSAGGLLADSLGYASHSITAIPEPSVAALALGLAAVLAVARFRKASAQPVGEPLA